MITISKLDPSRIDPEVLDFAAIECMDCNFDEIPTQYFLVTPEVETDSQYAELKRLVKEQTGNETFTEMSCNAGHVISVSRCPKCGSEDIYEDF